MDNLNKGNFKSNFGFLMAAVGSAVGLGNIWGFPYKMGANGGFAFLLIYIILAIVAGYPLMLAEISLGRKTRKAAVEAYRTAHPKFAINGVFATIVPFFLLCFYCVLGGIVIRYMLANLGDIFHASWGVHGQASDAFFGGFISNMGGMMLFTALFLLMTSYVVFRGIENGIEKFCSIGMPLLALMLIITDIRCCTLPGASGGLNFMFKPDFSVFAGTGWFKVFATAGSQMFFSISLASGALIAFGSYMKKEDDMEKSAMLVPFLDTIAALLAGLAVIPAVFSAG
ncbi:MAG: sodium-dependent transporter, partial [Eubacterium sp.]|nr:sodium-dependent transporter [Eubacterium sp.]